MRVKFAAVNTSELEEMQPVCVEHRGVPYCVVLCEGAIRAYVSVCSHKDLPMFPPETKKGHLVCPHHNVSFEPQTGEVAKSHGKSVPSGLMSVGFEVQDGVVLLEARKRHRKLLSKKQRRKVTTKDHKRLGM